MQRLGQAGLEYIILIGVLLFFFIPIVYFSLTQATIAVKQTLVESIINRLGKSADAMYALGPGSAEVLVLTMPDGISGVQIGTAPEDHLILLKVTGYGGTSDVHVTTKAVVQGDLPTLKGTYFIKVQTLSDGTICIKLKDETCS